MVDDLGKNLTTSINVDPKEGPPVGPFVYLQMSDQDLFHPPLPPGGHAVRSANSIEYASRKPRCVRPNGRVSVTISISNAGRTASDLVWLDYKIIFCTYLPHLPQQGFDRQHAENMAASEIDKAATINFVPAGKTIPHEIVLPANLNHEVCNIYLRARVSTIWTPRTDSLTWDPLSDFAVTEAHWSV
ncbi:MAG: hypothetical protein ACK58T_35300 [Phycisphaerae bacterium]|jgi:hypothetical protein